MTTSRIVRGTKGRVVLYICAILFVTGLIACYNNVRVQLEQAQKSFELCRKEQDDLSTQYQFINNWKEQLEKNLKDEQTIHTNTKHDFERRFNEEKLKYDKINNDSKLRFSSLQQHYNLLQTQYDDFKEESSKIQRTQLDEISTLQTKLKDVQAQLMTVKDDQEALKNQNKLLVEETVKQIDVKPVGKQQAEESRRTEFSTRNFSKLVEDGNSHYIIADNDKSNTNVDEPPVLPVNKQDDMTNVLALPSNLVAVDIKSSTPNSLRSSSKANLNVLPLRIPTVTPESPKSHISKEMKLSNNDKLAIPHTNKRLPEGVVPIPMKSLDDNKIINNEIPQDDVNTFINNRYRSNIVDAENKAVVNEKVKLKNSFDDIVENDNANEVFDLPNNAKVDERLKNQDVGKEIADEDEEHRLPEVDEDDDTGDGANPIENLREDIAIRN